MKNNSLILVLLFFIVAACSNPQSTSNENFNNQENSSQAFDPNAYVLTPIDNSQLNKAVRIDTSGWVLEEGFLQGDLRQGTWITYHKNSNLPASITSFVNGIYNGKYLEYNDRGQMTLLASYKNNLLDGPWEKYNNFGRPVLTGSYKNGKQDGLFTEYHPTKINILQKEIEFKEGKKDGIYRYYNEEGEATVEYIYKNDKQKSRKMLK